VQRLTRHVSVDDESQAGGARIMNRSGCVQSLRPVDATNGTQQGRRPLARRAVAIFAVANCRQTMMVFCKADVAANWLERRAMKAVVSLGEFFSVAVHN